MYIRHIFNYVLLFAVAPALNAATIYKWMDKEGIVHYADSPQRNATVVFIQDDEKKITPPKATPSDIKISTPVSKSESYGTIKIEQPSDQETLQNTGGEVTIKFSTFTLLAQGERWQVLVDGKKNGEPQTQNTITLQNIDRGEHTLQIQAIDSHDKVLASSAIITVYVTQTMTQQ